MAQAGVFDAVFGLEAALGVSWPHIHRAHQRTEELHRALVSAIEHLVREDASIVVFGSLGRFEVTGESDIDWTYLIDGQADLRHQAAGLLYSFGLTEEKVGEPERPESLRKQWAIERLWIASGRPPLDVLAGAFAGSPSLAAAARLAFTAYDEFLGMLETVDIRERLDKLAPEDAERDDHYQRVREIGRQFQDALSQLFITDESTPLPKLTREYGVF